MKISINKATGIIFESSSASSDEAMIANAAQYGIEVDIQTVTDKECEAMLKARDVSQSTYTDRRRAKYPSIQDQLDMQYKDAVNGTTLWKDLIAAIKTSEPKP